MKSRLARGACKSVPWTDRETIVAAVDAVPHLLAEFAGNVSLVLDGEVRDAAPRIDAVRRGESVRRTGIETTAAAAAMIVFPRIGRKRQRRQYKAEKQPRAEFARHQIGVLALPAEASLLRQRLFHHRRGVDEDFHLGLEPLRHEARELLQPA